MSLGSNTLSKSLKHFHKRERTPVKKVPTVQSINVYQIKKGFSLQPSLDMRNTSMIEKCFTCQDYKTLTSTQACSISSFKTLKLKKNRLSLEENPKEIRKNPIFQKKSINIDKLTSLSQKESIIFNQVKNLAPPEKEKNYTMNVLEPELLKAKRMRTNKFKKLSTMRKVQLSEETEALAELEEEKINQPPVLPKRKKLKQHVWRWVGAGGDEVY